MDVATSINLRGKGMVNGSAISFQGTGVIRCIGVYHAIMNFNEIPRGFHPAAIGTFSISTCCGYGASTRNGAKNLSDTGATEYVVERNLVIGDGRIDMKGLARIARDTLDLNIEFSGEVSLPEDLACHSVYYKTISSEKGGQLLRGSGNGSLFRNDGTDIKVEINSLYELQPAAMRNPITSKQYRVASESGILAGSSYTLCVHSIFDGADSFK